MNTILVTGGAGFIGSASCANGWPRKPTGRQSRQADLRRQSRFAGPIGDDPRHLFVQGDIGDLPRFGGLFDEYRPRAMVHFAAESHVDRSIDGPAQFVHTNVVGTFRLLEAARRIGPGCRRPQREHFRFLHVSTDEVFGSLGRRRAVHRRRRPMPRDSPYSASKAAADHFVRAYHHTYGLPVLMTNCSNNYGPYQFPEKLIPLMILNALEGKPLPVYGDGQNIRDWLFVDDHCQALRLVLDRGTPGETYNIGGDCERANLDVVRTICATVDGFGPACRTRPANR